jgi:mannose-1-phosphate guanylyltransferase
MLVLNKENRPFTLVQPENHGTAPAALYSLMSIARQDPTAIAALFLASHYGIADAVFMQSVGRALRLVDQSPGLLILPGVIPHFAATSCEWIEPRSGGLGVRHSSLLRVERIWQKPALYDAERLLASGCLWNSSVLVASVRALICLIRAVAPVLYQCFELAAPAMGTVGEADAIGSVYARLPFLDFGSVLGVIPEILNVLPVLHSSEFLGQVSPGKGEIT